MDDQIPGPTLASLSSNGVSAMADGGAGVDRPAGLAGQEAADRPTGYGLSHPGRVWQRIRLTGDPSYKSVLLTTGNYLAWLADPNVGAVRWTFPQYQFP